MTTPDTGVWIVVAVGGALTYALRASFVLRDDEGDLHPALDRALGFVPAAVLAGLVAPSVLAPQGVVSLVGNVRLVAAVVALVAAWVTEDTLTTIGVGMAVFWALRFLA